MSDEELEKLEKRRAQGRAYSKKWRERNPHFKRSSKSTRDWQKRNPVKNSCNMYKQVALRKGMKHEISDTLFEQLVKSPCYYCGSLPSPINGIDRVDNSEGYIETNVVPACAPCNYAKRNRTQADFISWAFKLSNHLKEKQ